MYLVAQKSPISSTQGNFIFSRTEQVERLRLGRLFPAKPERLPPEALGKIISDHRAKQTHELLLAVNPGHLPEEIFQLLKRGNLAEDFERFCKAVVFCSYLSTTNCEWTNGFVLESDPVEGPTRNPYSFSETEIQALSGNFLEDPLETIFVNACKSDGRLINNLGFFPVFAFHIGYLKAKSEMAEKVTDPNSISYALKASFAATYALSSVQVLFLDLVAANEEAYRPYSGQFQKLVTFHEKQLANYLSLVSPEDKTVLELIQQQRTKN